MIYEKIGCNPEMMHYTGWNPYHSLESTEAFITGIIEGYHKESADYSWIIESDGHAVGIIGAYDLMPKKILSKSDIAFSRIIGVRIMLQRHYSWYADT